jgi:ribosomal-protein-alanine N-acetyltransferase
MQEADLAAVLALETRSYAFPWTEGIFRDCLRVGYFCSVLEIDYLLAGYGVISSAAGEAHLLNLCVREEFRCRGLGRRLLDHLLDLASHSGARLVFLEVRPGNTAAIRLYETMFFQQIGMRRGYYQAEGGREDALVMRRDLTV